MGAEGTVHYQGYVEFETTKRLGGVRALEPGVTDRFHWEPRLGSVQQAYDYCVKHCDACRSGNECTGTLRDFQLTEPEFFPNERAWERMHGNQGKRNDVAGVIQMVQQGLTNEEIAAEAPVLYMQRYRGIHALRAAQPMPAWEEVQKDCVVYWGPTRTGKSYRLRQECSDTKEWFWASEGKWLDGYEGQAGIVFDEMRDSWYTWQMLLRLLDPSPMRMEVKGLTGGVIVRAVRFRISTNVHPKFWYKGARGKPNQPWRESPLRARMSRIIHMNERRPEALQAMDCEDDDEPSSEEELGAPLVEGLHGALWHQGPNH
jgi:hypothetical protein